MPVRKPKRVKPLPPAIPLPRRWLMTDERMGDALWPALRRLPPGSGIVFRHYATPAAARRRMLLTIRRIARARGLVLVVAGGSSIATDGVHGRAATRELAQGLAGGGLAGGGLARGALRTWPAHDRAEALAGSRAAADALFVSPLYATRSHVGGSAIGPARARRIGRGLGIPLIALGGMDAARWARIRHLGFHGWAAIDAWLRD